MICKDHNLVWTLGTFAYAILECWLGKTKKVEANSVFEMVFKYIFKEE